LGVIFDEIFPKDLLLVGSLFDFSECDIGGGQYFIVDSLECRANVLISVLVEALS